MASKEQERMSREELLEIIDRAAREESTELNLFGKGISELPPEIGQLTNLEKLDLSSNQLTSLPAAIGQLTNLTTLNLGDTRGGNYLKELPDEIGQLTSLQVLSLGDNQLTSLPGSIGQLTNLVTLDLWRNRLTALPPGIGELTKMTHLNIYGTDLTRVPAKVWQRIDLTWLSIGDIQLKTVPSWVWQQANLEALIINTTPLTSLSSRIGDLTSLQELLVGNNRLSTLPLELFQLANLELLQLSENELTAPPPEIGQLTNLRTLELRNNQLTALPISLARLEKLEHLDLNDNPLNPVLQSTYESGLEELMAYLRSLGEPGAYEELYEAKLVLVGEGGVGKTTLLKALTGQQPREDEPTTHGVNIDIQSLQLPHPDEEDVEIQFNAWDFGGQEVYRITHQFFFSRRSVYLLVWEPRRGVQQCQVEDWLKLIRLRVGDDARVIIVSTHCRTGQRIARIDKPVLQRDFCSMIVGFHEVDSLVPDPETGEMVGVAELKAMIAEVAKDLHQMGTPLNRDWRESRDELLALEEPHIAYQTFAEVCERHSLNPIATKTLADLMHDLGYVVYYGEDERLKDDIVLQPQWLTKAIGFVLEDETTQEMDGILPDSRLWEVWRKDPADGETRFDPQLYPFFLRLMEKFDVSYRLEEGDASLVAQHVSQVRPDLPWLPEEDPAPGLRRLALVCVMNEAPPGLVPWMIVRTHDYAYVQPEADRQSHRLHWQKGVFLRNNGHGEAMLELRGREFHIHTQAVYPEFFTNVLRQTLHKLITDNWPGMQDRYHFAVPCQAEYNGGACDGRFDIDALSQFLNEGDETIRCQVCRTRQDIKELLFGFEEEDSRAQLARLERKLDRGLAEVQRELEGLESRLANYVMAVLQAIASESKAGPRLFTIAPMDGDWRRLVAKRYRLHL